MRPVATFRHTVMQRHCNRIYLSTVIRQLPLLCKRLLLKSPRLVVHGTGPSAHGLAMQLVQASYARSISAIATVAISTLLLANCATADPTTDQINEEFDGTIEHPTKPVCGGGNFTCKAHVVLDENNRIRPFALPAGLGPADLTSAYKLNPAITSTATMAIIAAFHYPNAESDLAIYRSTFGLPPCTVASGCLTIVNPTGAGPPPTDDDWNLEAALDLDMASAACPTCKLVLVEATNDQGNDLFSEKITAAARSGVVAISNSWGGPSSASDASFETFFNHTQNVNTFVSSGDSGNTGTTGDYPSTSEFVIAVGGTRLTKSTTAARGWTETAWSGAGSTCSRRLAEPSFQTGTVPTAACTRRAA